MSPSVTFCHNEWISVTSVTQNRNPAAASPRFLWVPVTSILSIHSSLQYIGNLVISGCRPLFYSTKQIQGLDNKFTCRNQAHSIVCSVSVHLLLVEESSGDEALWCCVICSRRTLQPPLNMHHSKESSDITLSLVEKSFEGMDPSFNPVLPMHFM